MPVRSLAIFAFLLFPSMLFGQEAETALHPILTDKYVLGAGRVQRCFAGDPVTDN